ncbi:hypothetical protein HYX07_05005 [Candidatus Woesearchaeota archaeon]|nr:hypothetical protein [Candidatus Woesearchaeota archaeon]
MPILMVLLATYLIETIGKSWTKSLKNYAPVNFKVMPKSKSGKIEYWQTN